MPAFQSQCKCQPFSTLFPDQPARSYFLQHSALNGIGTSWHSGYICPWKVSHLLGHSPWQGLVTSILPGTLAELNLGVSVFSPGYRYVILDIPLLFETQKLLKYMKHTVVVYW